MDGSFFFALAAMVAGGVWTGLRRRKSPEEKEREKERLRREFLMEYGRMIDGIVLDYTDYEVLIPQRKRSKTDGPPPTRSLRILHYQYEIAGVIYESGQDVSFLPAISEQLTLDSSCLGMPASIRYHMQNPANSIVVAETWNGMYCARKGGGRKDGMKDTAMTQEPSLPPVEKRKRKKRASR